MGVSAVVTRVACNTSTGTQDITVSGFGTPVAAMFVLARATTEDTNADSSGLSVGFTDGTLMRVMALSDNDAAATMETDKAYQTTDVILMLDPSAGTLEGSAHFDSWITDGVRIDWDDAVPSAYLLVVYLFGGTDVTAYVNHATMNSASDVDVTDPGFAFDAAVFLYNDLASASDATAGAQLSLGFAGWDGATLTQCALMWSSQDSPTAAAPNTRVCTDSVGGTIYADTESYRFVCKDVDANGFTLDPVVGSPVGVVPYLALNFGGAAAAIAGRWTNAGGTGDQAFTWPGFTPQLVMGTYTHAVLADNNYTTGRNVDLLAVFGFDDTREYTSAICVNDAVGTSNTVSHSASFACQVKTAAGTETRTVGAFTSFDSGAGFTLNLSTNAAAGLEWCGLAIEEFVVAPTGIVPFRRRIEGY